MSPSIKTETETVIKKILPYLKRREYIIEEDLDFETSVTSTDHSAKGYVDILVTCGKQKPQFLIEAKRSSKKLSDKDRNQAISYGKSLKVPFVVVTNGADIRCFNVENRELIRWNGKNTEKIPTKSQLPYVIDALKVNKNSVNITLGNDSSLPFRPGLPLKQLNALFSRCHNAIRKIEKDEENAFADFSKLLFLKLLEEKSDYSDFVLPYSYKFHELADRPETESDQIQTAINDMINRIKQQTPYGDVLEENLRLKNPKTFRYIVRELASVSFQDSSLDSKGAAFEYFVRATLKGKKLGQYFTPRPLIEFISTLVGGEKIVNALLSGGTVKLLDPACGTGGFLVFLMQENLRILERLRAEQKINQKTHDLLKQRIEQEIFFGSDANPGVAGAAKMNMIIAGDGHTNIKSEDSLAKDAANWTVDKPDCDFILTNPPFGTSESNSLTEEDLNQYPLRRTKGQHLFLQKMVLSTVPHGEICTVIDEGVLNTDTAKELRKWLLETCIIRAIVRLPEDTFKPNKINVRSSVLYLERRAHDDVDLEEDYSITFCNLQSLGYTGAGESIRGFDFGKLMVQVSEQLLNSAYGSTRAGYEWNAFDINAQTIVQDESYRLDYKYWSPEVREQIELARATGGLPLKELVVDEIIRGKSPPAEAYVDEIEGYALVVKAGSNISKFGELLTDGDYIEKNVYDEMEEAYLCDGDILLASTGDGTLGKCCVFRSEKPAIADGHVTIVRVNSDEYYPEYVCDYLRLGFGAQQIDRLYTGSTGLIELTPTHINSIVIDLRGTDLAGQKLLSQELRARENEYREMIRQAESMLSDARHWFSGKDI